jgi:hypothetical protein
MKHWLKKENRHCGLMVDTVTGEPFGGSETLDDNDEIPCKRPVRHCVKYPPHAPSWAKNLVWYMCAECYDRHMEYFRDRPGGPVDV